MPAWTQSDEDRVRNLPPGTHLRDPYTGEDLTLDRHTPQDDGWWLSDGSWLRWHHVAEYLTGHDGDSDRA